MSKIVSHGQQRFLPNNTKLHKIASDFTEKRLKLNQIEKSILVSRNSLSKSDCFPKDERDQIDICEHLFLPDLGSANPLASLSESCYYLKKETRIDIEISENLFLPDLDSTRDSLNFLMSDG